MNQYKKETSEEAAEKEYQTIHEQYSYDAFVKGAKWQAERMYSEEDMRKMYDKYCGLIGLGLLDNQTENDNRFKELFESFKKK